MPQGWRKVNVVPLSKKDSSDSVDNNRLVSLTSVIENLLEKILKEIIYVHFERQGLIRCQHSFVKEKFYLTNLLIF